jgi:hypothetical protein
MNPEREIRQAMRALQGFYETMLEELTAAVLEKEDSLHTGYLGSGETIVDRYGPILLHLSNMLGCMHRAVSEAPPPPPPPLFGVDEVLAPAAEIRDRLGQWIALNPGSRPISVQILPGEPDARAVIFYQRPSK